MRSINSALRLALIAASALLVSQTAVHAQQPGTAAVAKIPFDFQIGSYHYPAGSYTVQLVSDHVVSLRSNADSAVMEVNWDIAKHPSTTGELVFHHYGDRYFLRQMSFGPGSQLLTSPLSKQERSAQKGEAAVAKITRPDQEPNVRLALAQAFK